MNSLGLTLVLARGWFPSPDVLSPAHKNAKESDPRPLGHLFTSFAVILMKKSGGTP